jgi:glutamate synthase domain-containing protein 1
MLQKEGMFRNPSGCAISGMIHRKGERVSGDKIITSISYMHDRSNGLCGGFAGYGIYPEYKNQYALHLYYDDEGRQK